jgi:hypothetical protein
VNPVWVHRTLTKVGNRKFKMVGGRGSHPRLVTGNVSENRGAEIGRKRVIFGGFWAGKGGSEGRIWGSGSRKKGVFCVREG